MKMRADLTFERMTYQGVEYWVVKEPLGQKYFQFPPHVFYLLRQLDGQRSVEELLDGFHRVHAPKRITRSELQQLLTRFHKDGLVISDMTGQGIELLRRGRKTSAMERLASLSNILAIRWRGIDPEWLLNKLIPWTSCLFSPPAVVAAMLMGIIALLSVVANFTEFQARLPGFDAFFDPRRWFMFVAVLAVTKIFHEFGHGLSCKRLGGECHEIGFMMLVLTPCLYCNVSDSWRLPNKWHRAAIGAAGMYVEVILASIATFVWWFVEPGWVQDVCLQVMLISSVSTVLFNGNPLLRFDGYYILSDLLEIPNLYQKSTKALTTLIGRHWLGLEIPDDQLMPTNRPWAFAAYTVAAFCYRWFILVSIIIFLTRWLEPYGLDSIGKGIAVFAVIGLLLWPSYRLFRFMSVPGRMHQIKKPRFAWVSLVLICLFSAMLLIPFPHYLRCSLIMVPKNMETVYIQESGTLKDLLVQPGDRIQPGQKLAQLQNLDLELTLTNAEGQLALKLDERQALLKAELLNRMDTVNSEIARLRQVINELQKQRQRLDVKSTIEGTVLDTPFQPPGPESSEVPLVDHQPLLSGRNVDIAAVRGQRFCEVADLDDWHAIVLLTEKQIKFARENQLVKLKLYSQPGTVIESRVESIGVSDQSVRRENKNTYSQLEITNPDALPSALPDLVTEMVAATKHADIQYFARVPVELESSRLKIGQGGQARLFTGYRSWGQRVWWWFNQNFRT
jgi:putative peptide zinc metalloprotease protein